MDALAPLFAQFLRERRYLLKSRPGWQWRSSRHAQNTTTKRSRIC
jgi:hypothetical protein